MKRGIRQEGCQRAEIVPIGMIWYCKKQKDIIEFLYIIYKESREYRVAEFQRDCLTDIVS